MALRLLYGLLALIAVGMPQPAGGQIQRPLNALKTFSVAVDFNITYGYGACLDGTGQPYWKALKLDVYYPRNNPSPNKAVMVLVHGAVWGGGNIDKRDPPLVDAAHYFAGKGMVCFSIDFRNGKDDPDSYGLNKWMQAQWASFVDAKAAVRYIRANAQRYGIDPDRIAAYGGSSGAGTAIMLAATDPMDYATDYPGGQIPAFNHPNEDPCAQTCIEFWGTCYDKWYGNPPEQYFFDFSHELDGSDPPMLIAHGTLDIVIPYKHAEAIVARCNTYGIYYKLYTLVGEEHGAWGATYGSPPKRLNELVLDFITQDLGWSL